MLGTRRLVVDTMSEIYRLVQDCVDEEFWDFSQVVPQPNSVYVVGRQQLMDNSARIREMAESGLYVMVFNNSAEGSWTLEAQLVQLRINQLILDGRMLVIGGAAMHLACPQLTHEHLLITILDYEKNLAAQQRTPEIFAKTSKPYKFLYLNGRARPHRKYLYERFKRTGILDQALWTMLDSRPIVTGVFEFVEGATNIMATASPLQRLPDVYEVDRYREPVFGPIVPDRTFLKQELFKREWGEIYLEPMPYIDTYFSLVTETICGESSLSFRTEKIAKPLAMGHPFIVTANQGYYRDLRNLGFRTFNTVIDESFDSIDSAQERMDRIVDIVVDLCQQDLESFLLACRPICEYNQQHLAEFARQHRAEFPNKFMNFVNAHG